MNYDRLANVERVLRNLAAKVERQPIQGKCARETKAEIDRALLDLADVRLVLDALTRARNAENVQPY